MKQVLVGLLLAAGLVAAGCSNSHGAGPVAESNTAGARPIGTERTGALAISRQPSVALSAVTTSQLPMSPSVKAENPSFNCTSLERFGSKSDDPAVVKFAIAMVTGPKGSSQVLLDFVADDVALNCPQFSAAFERLRPSVMAVDAKSFASEQNASASIEAASESASASAQSAADLRSRLASISSDASAQSNLQASASAQAQRESQVVYRVTGSVTSALVSFMTSGFNVSQETGATVPWYKHLTIAAGSGRVLSLSAQNNGAEGSITCTIEVAEKVVSTSTSTGAYAIATCSS